MSWIRVVVIALALGGCVRQLRFGVGTRRDDWKERLRRVPDPDPTANPTLDATDPWSTGESSAPARPCHLVDPPDTRTLGEVIAAELAHLAGGWAPLFVLEGTFEEDPDQARRDRDRQRARCAEATPAAAPDGSPRRMW